MAEHGYYHPTVGYWQANDTPDEDMLKTYPEGTIEVPLKPVVGYWDWDGDEWQPGVTPKFDYSIPKALPWTRMTEAEADIMNEALNNSPSRTQQMYYASTVLSTKDALWPLLTSLMEDAFGDLKTQQFLMHQ